jgi:hypothetical protein
MRFLGFWDGVCLPDEIKTYPLEHVFSAPQYIGPDTKGETA